jgi:hypothetical protein
MRSLPKRLELAAAGFVALLILEPERGQSLLSTLASELATVCDSELRRKVEALQPLIFVIQAHAAPQRRPSRLRTDALRRL